MNNTDVDYMTHAINLATKGLYTTHPNPRVGCVLVKAGTIIAEGWHQRAGHPHAEQIALKAVNNHAQGATAYITLEPCCHYGRTPPCSKALIAAGITRAVIAMQDPNPQVAGKGIAQLKEAGIQVDLGILEHKAQALNPGFNKRMTYGLPWVCCKMAMSLDGRTAPATKERQWITSSAARHDVQLLRARSAAIMTGIGTVLADDPALTVRIQATELPGLEPNMPLPNPLRVILDSRLRTPTKAKILQDSGRTLIICGTNADPQKIAALTAAGATIKQLPETSTGQIAIESALRWLAKQEINEVLLESGSILAGAVLEAGLVDEMIIYMAPHIMGDNAIGLFHLSNINNSKQRIALEISEIQPIGTDWRIRAQPVYINRETKP